MQRAPKRDESQDAAFHALHRALGQYRRGEADVKACADEAGLPEWSFIEEAQACPDPVAPRLGTDLPTFIRPRD